MHSHSILSFDQFGLKGTAILSSCPGLTERHIPPQPPQTAIETAKTHLSQFQDMGGQAVLSLLEESDLDRLELSNLPALISNLGLKHEWFPIIDRQTPKPQNQAALKNLLTQTLNELRSKTKILIHCQAGLGRTGTFAGLLLLELGLSADEAIAEIRETRKGTIETSSQEDFIRNWKMGY